jgi:hypothetical protein
MKKYTTSILIPARNEEWLARTIQDILENKNEETEIIIGLDGQWSPTGIEDHKDIVIVYYNNSLGQRQITNQLCKLSNARYIIKCDAHVAFDKDFDRKMMDAFAKTGDNVVMVPIMKNLHVFNWLCPDGHTRYQSPSGPCQHELEPGVQCGKETTKDVVWIAKQSPQSKSYSFDSEPHFQYYNDYCKRDKFKKDLEETGLTESMSLQGSFFMMTREKYWELNIGNEDFGSWGSQAIQIACSFWLSGGKVIINNNTWYSHMFRTQGGDFGFPYPQSGNQVNHAKKHAKKIFFEERWPQAIRPVSWLVERFWPVTYWKDEDLVALKEMESKVWPTKGIIYYTDNKLNLKIAHSVQKQLKKISEEKNIPIVSASLKPMPHFGKNIHLPLERGVLTMFKQILVALEASDADIIYFAEHDVLYHHSHFDFVPSKKDQFYYNTNWWKVRLSDKKVVGWSANQVSGLVAYREHLIAFYRNRVKELEENGVDKSYEPGRRDQSLYKTWKSEYPNIDIRHENNLTHGKWSKDDFKDKSTCIDWKETTIDKIESWEGLDKLF